MSEREPLEQDPVEEGGPTQVATSGASVLRGGVWKLVSSSLPQIYTLIVSVVAARVLGPHGMGRQSLISFVELAAIALLSGGLSGALMRYIAETAGAGTPGVISGLVSWAWRIALGLAAIGWAALAAVALAGGEPTAAWVLAAVTCAASVMNTIPSATLIGLQRWRDATIAGLTVGFFGTGATIAVLLLGGGITGMFAVETVGVLAALLWTSTLARRAERAVARPRERAGADLRRAVRRFALLSSVGVVLELVVWRRSEFFFLAYFSNDAEIAYYSIAFAIVNAVIRLPATAASVFAPAAANLYGAGSHDRIRTGFSKATRLVAIATLPIVALMLALGPRAITVIWGDDFEGAQHVLRVLAASSLIVPFSVLSSSLLTGIGRIRALVVCNISAAVVDVGLALLLVPGHDALGAAYANAGAQITAGGMTFLIAMRAMGWPRLGASTLIRAAAAALGAGVLAWAVQDVLEGVAGLLVGLAAGASMLLALYWLFHVLSANDAEFLDEAAGDRLGPYVHRVTKHIARARQDDR